MKTFRVHVSREDYGYVKIQAETPEEANELVENGEYDEEDFVVKGAEITVEDHMTEEVEEIAL